MYESGGQMHWSGHLAILFILFLIGDQPSNASWHERLLSIPFFAYLGYFIWKTGVLGFSLLRQILNKLR